MKEKKFCRAHTYDVDASNNECKRAPNKTLFSGMLGVHDHACVHTTNHNLLKELK